MTDLLTLLTSNTGSGQTATQGGTDILSVLTMLIPLALMIVIFYFLIIRPEKKRSKKMKEMYNQLQIGFNQIYQNITNFQICFDKQPAYYEEIFSS